MVCAWSIVNIMAWIFVVIEALCKINTQIYKHMDVAQEQQEGSMVGRYEIIGLHCCENTWD